MSEARRKRVLVSAAIGAIAAAIALGMYFAGTLGSLESKTVDTRFDVRGSEGAPSDVVVVAIDDTTFDELGLEFPFPRCLHANVIDRIARGNPRAIAIDIQFTEPSDAVAPDGVACDDKLVEAVDDAGKVVLSTTETDESGRTQILGGDANLARIGARPAISLVPYDDDSVLRHLPYEMQKLKSLAIVAAEVATGRTIPEPSPASQWIDFAGPPGTVTSYSYSRVLEGKLAPSAFADKVVVIGATATVLRDFHPTSAGDEPMAGPEIQANMIDTALHGFPLRGLWGGWNVALIVLLALIAPLARLCLPTWQALLVALGAGALFLVGAQLLFEAGWIAAVAYPLLALGISCIGVLVAEVSHLYAVQERRVRSARQTRVFISAWIGGVAIAITLAAYYGHVMRSLEYSTVDRRFDVRGPRGTPSDLAIVAIDDATFNALQESGRKSAWPLWRCYYNTLIHRISQAQPKAIAVDIVFTAQSEDTVLKKRGPGTEDDQYIACDDLMVYAMRDAGNVVVNTSQTDEQGDTNVFGGGGVAERFDIRVGSALVPQDDDGVVRRFFYRPQKLLSFGILAAEIATGKTIPPPPPSHRWIDYIGPPGTVPTYSFSSVLDGKVSPSKLKDRIVVIGATASDLQDLHLAPFASSSNQVMPGAEIQANIAQTALRGFPLRSVWNGWNFIVVAAFALLAPILSLRMRGWRAPALAIGVGGLYLVAAQLLFNNGRVILVTYPLLALILSSIGVLIAEYLLEAVERVRTHDTFSRFVPEAVVNQVLERTGGELRLGGELVEGTAMFTDLRGFTTFSEGLGAEEVIGLLNGYLGEISDAVLANGGTLVSYLGDGLMAVFGAPLPQEDHADRAVAAAREMLEVRLPKYNETLLARGFERGFKMGIGLNSGPFMSGNVGSQRRLEYTAIGDTINTASRIEGMTKGTPYALYLADSTKEALIVPLDDLVYIDEMPVRGRTHPIKLWSLTGDYVQKLDWESEVAHATPAAEPAPKASPPDAEPLPTA